MMTAFEEWERNRWRRAPIDLQEKVVELIVSDARWRATREAAAKWAREAGMKECQALVDRLSSK